MNLIYSLVLSLWQLVRRPAVAGGLSALIAIWLAFHWSTQAQLQRKQAAFWDAITAHESMAVMSLLSESYHDRWGYEKGDVQLIVRDVSKQFVVLVIAEEQPTWEFDLLSEAGRPAATYSTRPQLDGRGISPFAGTVQSEVNSLRKPFTFHWEKESIWPWSWRLVSVSHPDLAKPNRYVPGMLSEQGAIQKLVEKIDDFQP